MKKLITPNRDRLEREVINWLVRLTSGEATPDDFIELAKWRERSPAHNHAYQKISALWDQLDKPLLAWHQQALLTENSLTQEECTEHPQIITRRYEKKGRKGLLAAAVFATLMLVGLFQDYVTHPFADFRTLIGERTSIILADGSIAHLNTNTAINIDFSSHIRRIELLHGEAEFEVAHDTHKPFIVSSGAIQTQAIGTKFIVRLDDSSGAVTLMEGRVQTSSMGSIKSDHQVISLAQRDQATFNDGRFSAVNQVDIAGADAWKNGRLQMNFVTLEQAVTEINRYRRGAVKLSAPQLAQHKINAVIDLNQIDVWLAALETTLPIQVLHLGPWVLIKSKT